MTHCRVRSILMIILLTMIIAGVSAEPSSVRLTAPDAGGSDIITKTNSFTAGSASPVQTYDTNGISGIQKDEAVQAVTDYLFNHLISRADAVTVVTAYLFPAGGLPICESCNISPPSQPVRLIFIHHSSGENWLKDDNGGLGSALRDNNYFVSDTNYGWGPAPDPGSEPVGSLTDIGHWWLWFRGPKSAEIMDDVYAESDQHASYARLSDDPGGENRIVMFKSCFPNSELKGTLNDPVPPIDTNPLIGEGYGSDYHTIANAKGIYIDLLPYFQQHQDTLFVVVTAPPVSDPIYAANARAFNQWLVNDWLKNYPNHNVAVFDFYNVLTTNGGSSDVNDLGRESGNHHRWWQNSIQHQVDTSGGSHDTTAYAQSEGDDHPSKAGNEKAAAEFIPLLNLAYHRWQGE